MRHKYLFPVGAFVALACVQLFQGCQIAGPVSSSKSASPPDPLQEEIRKQPSEGWADGLPAVSAAPVLKYIPLGTSIERAKTVMEAHGFRCSSDNKDRRSCLVCMASQNAGYMMAKVIRVTLDHAAGKITHVEVVTFMDGP